MNTESYLWSPIIHQHLVPLLELIWSNLLRWAQACYQVPPDPTQVSRRLITRHSQHSYFVLSPALLLHLARKNRAKCSTFVTLRVNRTFQCDNLYLHNLPSSLPLQTWTRDSLDNVGPAPASLLTMSWLMWASDLISGDTSSHEDPLERNMFWWWGVLLKRLVTLHPCPPDWEKLEPGEPAPPPSELPGELFCGVSCLQMKTQIVTQHSTASAYNNPCVLDHRPKV